MTIDATATAEWLSQFGMMAVLVSISLNVAISITGVLPSVFLSGANAIIFGPALGFTVSLLGEVIGAQAAYWLYHKGLMRVRRAQSGALTGRWIKAFLHAAPSKQLGLLLAGRLAPFIPSGAVTVVAVLGNVPLLIFMTSTIVGKAPSVAAEIWLGYSLYEWILK
ncbi:TVP38/TMEM64 family protein [Paenibacillus sp. GCM10023252]|uniref:TVP38/TMEM64 family protein n=1 Tax=Paenibacillus sp. GCM10023252 TaxID=3252649 RepID=UPI00361C9A0D